MSIRTTSKAYILIMIDMDFNKSVIQIITVENISLLPTSPGHPHAYTSTHPHPHPYSSPSSYICTPLLSSTRHTRTLLDPYTPLKPNQTATLVKPYTMVKTVQRVDHALLRSRTAVGTKEFPLLLVLCANDLNRRPYGKRWNQVMLKTKI